MGRETKTVLEKFWIGLVARLACLVCARFVPTGQRVECHHVAEGSGLRSWFGIAPLCGEHHRGKTGLHGMGSELFCKAYKVPGETEYGLLVWLIEDLSSWLKARLGWKI